MDTRDLLGRCDTAIGLRLGEYAGTVCEGIADRCSELPGDLPQSFFELSIDDDVLVDAEVAVGELGKV